MVYWWSLFQDCANSPDFLKRVPTAEEVAAIEADISGCRIQIVAQEGWRLSTLFHQDSYTYETALLFIGSDSLEEIERKSEQARARLYF